MTTVSTTALPRRNTTHTTEAAAYASPAMPTMRFSGSGSSVHAAATADQNSRWANGSFSCTMLSSSTDGTSPSWARTTTTNSPAMTTRMGGWNRTDAGCFAMSSRASHANAARHKVSTVMAGMRPSASK